MDLFAVCLWNKHDCELLVYFGESLVSMLEEVICREIAHCAGPADDVG